MSSLSNKRSRSQFACAWLLVFLLFGNLAMPLAAQGAASWISGNGVDAVELIPICTAQGIRLVPLSELVPDEAKAASGVDKFANHSTDPARPTQGSAFGHCDACLGGLNSLHAPGEGASLAWVGTWASPQVPAQAPQLVASPVIHSAEARGPPVTH